MPHPDYIDTPQTAADNSYSTNGLGGLDDLSPEKSFTSPSKGRDLVQSIRNGRGLSLKTPRAGARDALRLLPNGAGKKGEFTPLMMSVTKKNHMRRASGRKTVAQTPSFPWDNSINNGPTPGLPRMGDDSRIYEEKTSSSAGDTANETPLPQAVTSSSAQSTPLAQLPGRNGGGGVVGDGNMMTLREQENIIDKIEKENFGLKMKIHFLEQAMSQRGTEFNKAALRENTDLKVNRITMQRELHKFKKNIAQAERDAEVYRLQLEEYRERMKRKQADESLRVETAQLQSELTTKETEITKLRNELRSAQQGSEEAKKLRCEMGDLEAELREKDRMIEEREDEIESLKDNAGKESNAAADTEEELETAKRQIEELQEDLDRMADEAKKAREKREDAVQEKKQAEDNLEELRDEMMNKSFMTKGLSRQLEDKTARLEDQLDELQEKHNILQQELSEKTRNERVLQERLRGAEKEGAGKDKLRDQLHLAHQERDKLKRDLETMSTKLKNSIDNFQAKSEEKDLLQTRHDALTSESANLQRDLSRCQRSVEELEQALDEERQHAAQNDHHLRSQHKTEIDLLTEQVDSLHREINAKESQLASDHEDWEAQRRVLESASRRAEEKANGLQRTVNKLQEVEGTLSGREMKLQEALESEKQRHKQEEQVLHRQIQELNDDIAAKRMASDEQRTELNNAKEELRISIREQEALKEKVEQLEEEVEVLQANLEEEAEYAEEQRTKSLEIVDSQLQTLKKEKQGLQDQLANINIELHELKKTAKDVQAERDDLEAKLIKADKPADDTFNIDQEKRELRRSKQKLEKDLERLRLERDNLQDANVALEQEIDAEIDRANAEENRLSLELDQLRNKQLSTSEGRDRELTSAKNKVQRLEKRVAELEELLDSQTKNMPPSGIEDVSLLQHDLAEARKKESESLKRESVLKSTTRDLRSQVANLERELHDLQIAKLTTSTKSPSPSSSPSLQNDLAKARKDLLDAQTTLSELRTKNRELERQASKNSVHESERADLHALLKSSTLEAEALSLKLSDRDTRISDLKAQLRRLRNERERAKARAEAAGRELDALQERHESVLDKVQQAQQGQGGGSAKTMEKELRGLMKEVVWLRARCRREEGFRRDLAWSKGFMEMGEGIREACNQADLRMIAQMGVKPKREDYESRLAVRQRFRAAIFVVVAANRLKSLEREWRGVRKLGEGLKRMRGELEGKKAKRTSK